MHPFISLALVLTVFLAARCCALLGSSSCSRSLMLCTQPAPRLAVMIRGQRLAHDLQGLFLPLWLLGLCEGASLLHSAPWGRCAARASSASWREWPCLDVEAVWAASLCVASEHIFPSEERRRGLPFLGCPLVFTPGTRACACGTEGRENCVTGRRQMRGANAIAWPR